MEHAGIEKTYVRVFIALVMCTILTVALAATNLGHIGNILIGVLIASAKASLVGLFFMHLKYEDDRWIFGVVFFPLSLFVILCLAMMPDIGFPLPS